MNLDLTPIAALSPDSAFTTTKIPAADVKIEGKPAQSAYVVHDALHRAVGHVVKANDEWYAVGSDGRCSVYVIKSRAEALATLRILWVANLASTNRIAFTGLR